MAAPVTYLPLIRCMRVGVYTVCLVLPIPSP